METKEPSMGALMAFGTGLAMAVAMLGEPSGAAGGGLHCAIDFYDHNGSRMEDHHVRQRHHDQL
jgi:hypothetical protein